MASASWLGLATFRPGSKKWSGNELRPHFILPIPAMQNKNLARLFLQAVSFGIDLEITPCEQNVQNQNLAYLSSGDSLPAGLHRLSPGAAGTPAVPEQGRTGEGCRGFLRATRDCLTAFPHLRAICYKCVNGLIPPHPDPLQGGEGIRREGRRK